MLKKSAFILCTSYMLTSAQTEASSLMEREEKSNISFNQPTRSATQEDIKVFVECLDKFDVRDIYLQYGDDLSKIPQEKTVFLWRIEDAVTAYNNAMRKRYGT